MSPERAPRGGFRARGRSAEGRSLLPAPSQERASQWRKRASFPLTAAGQPRIRTGFPVARQGASTRTGDETQARRARGGRGTRYVVCLDETTTGDRGGGRRGETRDSESWYGSWATAPSQTHGRVLHRGLGPMGEVDVESESGRVCRAPRAARSRQSHSRVRRAAVPGGYVADGTTLARAPATGGRHSSTRA